MRDIDRKAWRMMLLSWLLFVMILITLAMAMPAAAQTATPTPTATPIPVGSKHQLASGNYFEIQRQIDYGQIAIVVSIMLLLLVVIAYVVFRFVTHYIY